MGLAFPRHVHKRGGVYYAVADVESYDAALAAGWSDLPEADWSHVDVYREWTPTCGWSADVAPADDGQTQKRGPGRPRKHPVLSA